VKQKIIKNITKPKNHFDENKEEAFAAIKEHDCIQMPLLAFSNFYSFKSALDPESFE
jgi:hypothetical protein